VRRRAGLVTAALVMLALLPAALMLGACSTYYAKPGGSAEEFEAAQAECQMAMLKIRDETRWAAYNHACLRAKGWRPQ